MAIQIFQYAPQNVNFAQRGFTQDYMCDLQLGNL